MKHRARKPAPPVTPPPGLPPVKATKAYVSILVTVVGLVGIHLTGDQGQAVVVVLWLAASFYGVWRARNLPKRQPNRDTLEDFTQEGTP